MRVVYSLLYWSVFFTVTVVFSPAVILLALLTWPFDATQRLAQYFTTIWAASGFRMNPRWSLEVRGRDRLLRAGACVICANHQSQVDIMALSNLHGSWRWVSKAEILRIPFLGWAMKAVGTPSVKRGDKASGQQMLEHCRLWLDRGVSILMFPEGTRSEDGTLAPFKPGAFKLALETGRPVLPVVVDGTRFALPKNSADASGRARVVLSVLDPIDPGPWRATSDVEGLAQATHVAIEAELARIRGASGSP